MSGVVGSLFGKTGKSDSAQQSVSGYGALPGYAQDAFKQGVTGVQNLATSNPGLFAPTEFTPMQNSAFNLAGAGFTPLNGTNIGSLTDEFMNPYTSDVVNTTNQQIMKANQGLLSQLGGDASNAGAFGGTRQGAAQALQNYNTLNTIAATDAGLNASGFNNAQSNAINSLNQNNANLQTQIGNLASLGTQQQQQNTATNQAPLTALQALIAAAQGLPASSNSSGTSSNVTPFGGIIPGMISAAGSFAKGGA